MMAGESHLPTLAAFATRSLSLGLLKPSNIVTWADDLIVQSIVPAEWMMDLSLGDPSDTMTFRSLLRAVPGEPRNDEAMALVNALVAREWKAGRLTLGQVRGIGWQLYQDVFGRLGMGRWGVVVECNGEYLDDGLMTEPEFREIVAQELRPFEVDIARLPAWV